MRRRVCEKLARYSDDYRSKKDVLPLVADLLSPVNSGDSQPEGSLTLTEFVEQRYLPSRAKKLRPSTMRSYRDLFRSLVRDRLGNIRLRDFHTKDGQHYFDKVADEMPHLSHQSLLRVKALLSSVFNFAKQEDAIRGANPVQGVKVEGRRYKPIRQAYTLEDIQAWSRNYRSPRAPSSWSRHSLVCVSPRSGACVGRTTPAPIARVPFGLAHAYRTDENRRERRESGSGNSHSAQSPG